MKVHFFQNKSTCSTMAIENCNKDRILIKRVKSTKIGSKETESNKACTRSLCNCIVSRVYHGVLTCPTSTWTTLEEEKRRTSCFEVALFFPAPNFLKIQKLTEKKLLKFNTVLGANTLWFRILDAVWRILSACRKITYFVRSQKKHNNTSTFKHSK